MTPHEEAFDRILALSAIITDDSTRELARIGLTVSRTHVLWVLHGRGPSTQAELAGALAVTPRAVTGLIDALVDGGFVVRSAHPTDRRAIIVALTESGSETMATMARQHAELAGALFDGFSDAEFAAFDSGLRAVLARFAALVDDHAAAEAGLSGSAVTR